MLRRAVLGLLLLPACGDDGAPAAPDAGADAFVDTGPGAEDIDFVAGAELSSGSWLLLNEWAASPNVAFVLPTADLAAARLDLFTVNRVWSMGAEPDGSAIYFSAWDAQQQEHFGITIGDAIQNSFVYQPATRTLRALAWGNINDECQEPSPDGAHLYLCRRYDFTPEGMFSGWRLGRIELASGDFEFLRPDAPGGPFELSPVPLPDGASLLFEERARPPATGATLKVRTLGSGAEVVIRAQAARPQLAPDGHRVLFKDLTDQSRLKILDLDAPASPVEVVSPTLSAGDAAWSPDGATIVYTVYDSTLACDHLEVVTDEGAAWSAPVRVRDCTTTGEFITDIDWLEVP